MIYLKWFLLVPVDLVLKITGLVFAPFFALFVNEKGELPDWLYWFATPDSNMFGCMGDAGFYAEHKDKTATWPGRWWVSFLWQWRNTSHGFSVFVLGVADSHLPLETVFETGSGDTTKYLRIVRENKRIKGFDLKGSAKYPGLNYRFRWRFGWKLHQDLNHKAQFVFSVSPFKKFEE